MVRKIARPRADRRGWDLYLGDEEAPKMTTATATIDIVANAAIDSLAVAEEIDALVALQAQIAELETTAREVRSRIREAMVRFSVDRVTAPSGHCATLSTVHRSELDRRRAAELLSPALLAELTRTTTSSVLRVR
jgi:hypothetical protein